MFDAKHLHPTAKIICKRNHFTPRQFEPLSLDRSWTAWNEDEPDFNVFRVVNSKREIVITASEMCYADQYLR